MQSCLYQVTSALLIKRTVVRILFLLSDRLKTSQNVSYIHISVHIFHPVC